MSDYKNSPIRNTNIIDDEGLKVFWDKAKQYIDENEMVVAAALTDLATKHTNLSTKYNDLETKYTDLETKYNNIDTESLYYLINPINLAEPNPFPLDILEQNVGEFDIKEKYVDTKYFVYKRLRTAYSVVSIYYTDDKYEFTFAEGCSKQKYTWDTINGTGTLS